MFGDNG